MTNNEVYELCKNSGYTGQLTPASTKCVRLVAENLRKAVPMESTLLRTVLEMTFNKYTCTTGSVIYWRDCVLSDEMIHGEQGYLWVYEDGETRHDYLSPDRYGI